MFSDVNLLAVLGATVATYILGAFWHGPLFGKYWMSLTGFTHESMSTMRLTAKQAMAMGFVVQIISIYVLAHFVAALGIMDISGALQLAFFVWLGFIAPTLAGGVLWENRSPKLFAFNLAYPLVSIALAAIILTLWQ